MSVIKRDRSISKLEFYKTARKLYRQIIFLLARDFGIKSRIRTPDFYTKHWDDEDAKVFLEILKKYGIAKVADDYELWMIEHARNELLKHAGIMMENVTKAYTIYATNMAEARERRIAQDRAITATESILQDLDLAADIFPVKVEKLMPCVDTAGKLIALLKGWRKGDNKRIKELKGKELEDLRAAIQALREDMKQLSAILKTAI